MLVVCLFFPLMLSIIAGLGVLFFCLNVLFDVSLFRFVFASRGAETFILRS